jgi:hypothetical protein
MMLTPDAIASELHRLATHLERRTDELGELLTEAAEAEATYRAERARAILTADGRTAEVRNAQADHAVAHLLHHRLTTAAVADACRESIRSTRAQIDAVRSMSASVRSAMELT